MVLAEIVEPVQERQYGVHVCHSCLTYFTQHHMIGDICILCCEGFALGERHKPMKPKVLASKR